MTIRVGLTHRTSYKFDRPVTLSPHEIRLRPAPHCRTPILSYSLKIEPAGHFLNWQQDPYGNWLARAVFPERATHLAITVDLVAEMTVINPFDFFVEKYADTYPFRYAGDLLKELSPFLETEAPGPLLQAWLARFRATARPGEVTVDMLVRLNQMVRSDVAYLVRMEPGVQTPEITLGQASGSCRDSGWLLVHILRHLGLAARFASGYLIQLRPDQKSLDGPSGAEADFTDLHAWAEVYLPGAGWIGLDPTSGLLAGEGHIPLACTATPGNAAPVTGFTDVADVEFNVVMRVVRMQEDPRVTLPYSPAQWDAIMAVGGQVDAELARMDVRLTQGGEPTFVSVDDMEGPEWNIAALSPAKRELAENLMHRLAAKFATHPLLHFGQGKWYPGEPLPRWALGIHWRADGKPLWRNPALFADRRKPGAQGTAVAEHFVRALATALGLDPAFAITAYEDAPRLLEEEAALPVNVDPLQADLTRADERARLARALQRGIAKPVGFVLPLRAREDKPDAAAKPAPEAGVRVTDWQSSPWPLRRERLYLLPGDSPLGLRLPLDSLPWVMPDEVEPEHGPDPFAHRALLRVPAAVRSAPPKQKPKPHAVQAADVIKTALCVQVREGHLCIFMPPLKFLEDYVALLDAVESVAEKLAAPVVIEGYTPPRDPRAKVLNVTPDPGVIEVNVHPASTWKELTAITQTLYEEARQSRLATEKFMLDGRHTGTGGGNHVTLGGATPADSPLLRRPDLLRSLITYWQIHPGLSYLFSGQFIGPTSQAPRVDEARDDRLYELEIAFQQLQQTTKVGEENLPWLTDRLLRHLLTDLTGNTHRSEFSIDKLYSPDGPTGRLGLLEFRGFEMPPHWQMSLVQILLLRALVARFWKTPCTSALISWDTQLHDRWMLPYFIAADMGEVLRELHRDGYAIDESWFAPFIEFRFPRYGTVQYAGIGIELRQAIEPWHVLGEEMAGTGTARYVDSSVERLQVKVNGMFSDRYAVACNGRMVPLTPTGVPGEFVAGVRFRAWSPPSALHPTIGVQAPLVFDLVDSWNKRSLGGCTYHVSHPGGRSYETFPVNANEAEARRQARFAAQGHTPGTVTYAPEPRNPAYPGTLDLRWQPDA
ncbi:MAG: transglutaminase family protein [Betaproteobacteria bacterium]|nr:transglutaminase family protein [Betaproteobacteria bacterium]